ncbi:MAG: D-2-hydroxyacid dehydrogenase [Nitrospinae bacterium]|nr:D-2-hydroxyacid dehydrogenase [Nitrospinota bacterium]MBL7020201.1 D-2-hydroxyacid dehydrogenase [Nitrospinaceae bacterium]
MSIKKILVYLTHPHVEAWNFRPDHKALLENRVPGLKVEVCQNSKDFKDRLPQSEAVIVWFFKESWLDSAPRLKLIATPAAGKDWVEVESGEGLQVSFGRFHGGLIAESVVGAMLYFLKAFPLSAAMQKQKKWARIKISEKLQTLHKSRVTILGFGRIGNVIAERLKPFGCDITGIKRNITSAPVYFSASDRILTFENWQTVFAETDHLICALPGEASGILQAKHFKVLPKSCYLYNVGRGNVYQESELIMALKTGEIAGAYLDVFEEEPLPESSPLWEINNVLIQPHLSAVSPQYLEHFIEELAGRINRGELGAKSKRV